MGSKNTKKLEEHSKAKVDLFGKYLSIYLNILSRTKSVDEILLFDLFCGEGIYEKGGKGSPIITLETIKNHYFSNGESCPNISILFNDSGKSEIEPEKLKITRVKEHAEKIFRPKNVHIQFKNKDFLDILNGEAIPTLEKLNYRKRALIFIDPWGYKEINPTDLKRIVQNGLTETILFLPLSFMHRFAKKSWEEAFQGGVPLRKFLKEIISTELPSFESVEKFILLLKTEFRKYLNVKFVDTFTIKRDPSNTYCLFFFTNNLRGYQKMLEAKWKIDEEGGKGYTYEKSKNLFSQEELVDYPGLLKNFIMKSGGEVTNKQIFLFGLENGFLPKHTSPILKDWKTRKKIEILSKDGGPTRGFYLDTKERTISIKYIK